jgi:hypothetical protein
VRAIQQAMIEMLGWRDTESLRLGLQDTLGLSVLPRIWRGGIEKDLGLDLWKPLVQAGHELLRQAKVLESRLDVRLCA